MCDHCSCGHNHDHKKTTKAENQAETTKQQHENCACCS